MTTEAGIPKFQADVHAGYTVLARVLNEAFPDRPAITRQMVHNWYMRRTRNGFPEGVDVVAPSGKVKRLFYTTQVREWYANYTPGRGNRGKRVNTTPVASVDN